MTPWAPEFVRVWYGRLVDGRDHLPITRAESLKSLISSRRLLEVPDQDAQLECNIFVLSRLLHDLSLKSFWSRLSQLAKTDDALEHAISAICYHGLGCFRTNYREEEFSQRQFDKWKKEVSSLAGRLAELLEKTTLDDPFGWWLHEDELKRLETCIGGREGSRALSARRRQLAKDEKFLLDTQNLLSDADLPAHSEQLRRLAAHASEHNEANYGGGLPSKPTAKYVQAHRFVSAITWYMRAKFNADERGVVSDLTNSLFGTKLDRKSVREIVGSIPEELLVPPGRD